MARTLGLSGGMNTAMPCVGVCDKGEGTMTPETNILIWRWLLTTAMTAVWALAVRAIWLVRL